MNVHPNAEPFWRLSLSLASLILPTPISRNLASSRRFLVGTRSTASPFIASGTLERGGTRPYHVLVAPLAPRLRASVVHFKLAWTCVPYRFLGAQAECGSNLHPFFVPQA